MVSFLRVFFCVCSLVGLTSCSELVKKVVQNNPEIVFEAIKKDPQGFMKVVRTAAIQAQRGEQEEAMKKEKEVREEEFKNPKKPDLEGRAAHGPSSAPITIVEYSDFQCPFCRTGSQHLDEVMAAYPGKVRVVFKHMPLEDKHPTARRASEYFEAIAMQDSGKAYKFKKLVFKDQNQTYQPVANVEKFYKKLARKAGANMGRLASDLKKKAKEISKIIESDMGEASGFGFNGTPGYLINGVSVKGAMPVSVFKGIIDRHMSQK